jgi:hypothetical protein
LSSAERSKLVAKHEFCEAGWNKLHIEIQKMADDRQEFENEVRAVKAEQKQIWQEKIKIVSDRWYNAMLLFFAVIVLTAVVIWIMVKA